MGIKLKELKKAIESPVIIGLIIVSIVANVLFIFNSLEYKKGVEVLNNIVENFGDRINDKSMKKFKEYYNVNLKEINSKFNKNKEKKYKDISEFLTNESVNEQSYTQNQIKHFNKLLIEGGYYKIASNVDEFYKNIDLDKIAEGEIKKYRLSGENIELVKKEYKDFKSRFDEIVKNKENKTFFFNGCFQGMHSLLFSDLIRFIVFEVTFIAIIVTSYLINYEFENETHLLVYTTKRGRNIIKDKLLVSMGLMIGVTTIILLVSLLIYFTVFDYSKVWHTPISSCFNKEHFMSVPHMSKWYMTFSEYLYINILFIYIFILIFIGITFIISRYIKNSYITFFVFSIFFGTSLIIGEFIPLSSKILFLVGMNPCSLITNTGWWFLFSGAFSTFKYYEINTAIIWCIFVSLISFISIKSFKRCNIY